MRLLVFCADPVRELEALRGALPDAVALAPGETPEQCQKCVRWFASEPAAVLLVGSSMSFGWRAPAETVVLFSPTFPDDRALRGQAAARVPPSHAQV